MIGIVVTEGVVVKVDHREQAIVSGLGGGGGVATLPDGRVVGLQRSTVISTHVRSTDKIWVQTESGKEIEFTVNENSFSCREGHKVIFVYDGITIWAAKNITSNRTVKYFTPDTLKSQFAPIHESSSLPLFLALCLGGLGIAGLVTAIKDHAPSDDPLYQLGIFLIPSVIILIFVGYKNWKVRAQRRKSDQVALQFYQELEGLVDSSMNH